MRAACSGCVHSKNVGTTRRVITSTWPRDTGNESKMAKQRAFAQCHSLSGILRNGEGSSCGIAAV